MRLVDGLADPARRRRAALVFCLAYATLWFVYGVIAKSAQDLNADMAEMVVWTRELALGYPKHPPLLAYILWAWFKVFPARRLGLHPARGRHRLGRDFSGDRAFAPNGLRRKSSRRFRSCSPTIPFYNFLGLKFDQNSVLIPLWALAMWAMLRALDTRHLGWAALAGLAAAAAMLVKYWSVFLIAALALAAVTHPRRRDYFRSAAPWVTAGVFLVAVAPHVVWLVRENFPPITWVTTRRVAASFGDTIASMLEALGGTFAYAAVAFALVLLFVRPSPAALRDGFLPQDERRMAANLFYVPLLVPVVPALIKNINLLSLWNTPALNLLPVMMLGSPLVTVPRVAVLRVASVVTVMTVLIVVASPFVAFTLLKRGVENDAAYARLLMEATEREWRKDTGKPLKLIAGPFVLVSAAAFYGKDQPSTYAHFSNYLSPWVDDARIARDGIAIMCTDVPLCLQYMNEVAGRFGGASHQAEVTLTRRWLGFEGPPARFHIAIVPPR